MVSECSLMKSLLEQMRKIREFSFSKSHFFTSPESIINFLRYTGWHIYTVSLRCTCWSCSLNKTHARKKSKTCVLIENPVLGIWLLWNSQKKYHRREQWDLNRKLVTGYYCNHNKLCHSWRLQLTVVALSHNVEAKASDFLKKASGCIGTC